MATKAGNCRAFPWADFFLRPLEASTFVPTMPIPSSPWREDFGRTSAVGLGEHLPLLVQLTGDLFGEDFVISVEQDPDICDRFDVVFTVYRGGTMDDILRNNTLLALSLASRDDQTLEELFAFPSMCADDRKTVHRFGERT